MLGLKGMVLKWGVGGWQGAASESSRGFSYSGSATDGLHMDYHGDDVQLPSRGSPSPICVFGRLDMLSMVKVGLKRVELEKVELERVELKRIEFKVSNSRVSKKVSVGDVLKSGWRETGV